MECLVGDSGTGKHHMKSRQQPLVLAWINFYPNKDK